MMEPVASRRGNLADWQVWPCKALAWQFGGRLPGMTMQIGTVVSWHGDMLSGTCLSWKHLCQPTQVTLLLVLNHAPSFWTRMKLWFFVWVTRSIEYWVCESNSWAASCESYQVQLAQGAEKPLIKGLNSYSCMSDLQLGKILLQSNARRMKSLARRSSWLFITGLVKFSRGNES